MCEREEKERVWWPSNRVEMAQVKEADLEATIGCASNLYLQVSCVRSYAALECVRVTFLLVCKIIMSPACEEGFMTRVWTGFYHKDWSKLGNDFYVTESVPWSRFHSHVGMDTNPFANTYYLLSHWAKIQLLSPN